ncbi:MAG: hypothetical protein M1819_002013 [Sarea resinae]|nr:MAG: hypothetical protein M1819_002013 [Sarea resinae]
MGVAEPQSELPPPYTRTDDRPPAYTAPGVGQASSSSAREQFPEVLPPRGAQSNSSRQTPEHSPATSSATPPAKKDHKWQKNLANFLLSTADSQREWEQMRKDSMRGQRQQVRRPINSGIHGAKVELRASLLEKIGESMLGPDERAARERDARTDHRAERRDMGELEGFARFGDRRERREMRRFGRYGEYEDRGDLRRSRRAERLERRYNGRWDI